LSSLVTGLKTPVRGISGDQPIVITAAARMTPEAIRQALGRVRAEGVSVFVIDETPLEKLAQLPPADERHRLFVEAATYQREQMDLFLLQQITPEDGSL